ncbi:hypothetical protein DFR70_11976 [Nocardia tenerifensis]|uniref:Uncharacterized protein n=1 Tax=Nocardia tenerifensis TaxID=228006 RepID=A0A318KD68_9NOCA|nr:hypothetical protein [Nocardia tenerifensis]PXX56524.1 hypothetical protein DFR70_11976 [Nocardia tenerifensis]
MVINKIQFDVHIRFHRTRSLPPGVLPFVPRHLPIVQRDKVVPRVDGVPLTDLIDSFELAADMQPAGEAYGGLPSGHVRFVNHFHGKSSMTMESKTPVLVCQCGAWGDWPLLADIVVSDRLVIWDHFAQRYRPQRDYSGFGPFRFDRNQYDDALQVLDTPTSSDLA